jgi:branched-chain amino acid aminotransferase
MGNDGMREPDENGRSGGRDPVVWLDGRTDRDGRSRVHALDHGMTVGDGAFESLKVVRGRPFALTRHLRRLGHSLNILGLEVPADDVLRSAVAQTLEELGQIPLARLRITVTGGAGPLGSYRGRSDPTLIVAAEAVSPWPERISVITVPWVRNERSALVGVKSTSYAENVVALKAAHDRGAHEALLANTRGELCEGTGSNVFVAVNGELLTPPLSSGCLGGITRELLLEWAAQKGLPIRERTLPMSVLDTAPEVVLTSSTRDVQAVTEIDGRLLPPGPFARAAADLFAECLPEDLDP